MQSVIKRKVILRKDINTIVNAMSKQEIERQSNVVVNKVLSHPLYLSAKSVSIYLSFDTEINTCRLVEDIFKTNKICYIPRLRKSTSDMDMIQLTSIIDYNNLPANKWGIKEPPEDDPRKSVFDTGSLDLIITPGLAFTVNGARLGRGKGYYDKFLAKYFLNFKKMPFTLAIALKEQIVQEIPTTETDIKIDSVLFDDGHYISLQDIQ